MSRLQLSAVFTIHDGKLDEFRTHVDQYIQRVRDLDTQTEAYDWFLSQDGTTCEVREIYPSSEALLEHIGHVGDLFPATLAISDLAVKVYGEPSAELVEATSEMDVVAFTFLAGA
jgi:quinol monooxygenase YgiN